MSAVELELKVDEPMKGDIACRRASIWLGGVSIFSEVVYDTDQDGNRTADQAQSNILLLFGERLRRLLEDS